MGGQRLAHGQGGKAWQPGLQPLQLTAKLAGKLLHGRHIGGGQLTAQCGAKGVKGAVVLAGGFAEAGAEGEQLQQQMVEEAIRQGVRIIGPNTSGMFNTHAACNIVGFSHLKPGGIGLLSQSGNMALSLVTEAQANGHVGLSTYIGIGNEADIRFHEYLEYFRDDPNTSAVIAIWPSASATARSGALPCLGMMAGRRSGNSSAMAW